MGDVDVLEETAADVRPRDGEWVYDKQERWRLTPPATRPVLYRVTQPDEP